MKFYQTVTKCFDNGKIVCTFAGTVETPGFRPGNTYRELPRYDLYVDYFPTWEEAKDFIKSAKTA